MSEWGKNIDNLFRNKFKDFELDPPDHVWKNVQKAIHQEGAKPNSGPFTKGGIAGIIVIVIVLVTLSLVLLFSPADNKAVTNTEDPTIESTQVTRSGNIVTEGKGRQVSEHTKVDPENRLNSDKDLAGSAKINALKKQTTHWAKNSLVVAQQNNIPFEGQILHKKSSEVVGDLKPINNKSVTDQGESVSTQSNKTTSSGEPSESIASEIRLPSNQEAALSPEIKSDYSKTGDWLFGIYFTPEVIFNPSDKVLNSQSYSLDIQAIYKFSDYFIQSGIGLARSKDEGNFMVNFNKYLGSYQDVYDVTFDTTSGTVIPIYHTETVKVYDSINHYTITPAKCYYHYLQIPFLFGYGKEFRRIGWFVKGGPSLSLMVLEKESAAAYSETDKVLNITNQTPARIKTNWQLMLSAGMTYKLSNRIDFSLEPVFRYYLSPMYDMGHLSAKHPYSLGLRSGLLFNF